MACPFIFCGTRKNFHTALKILAAVNKLRLLHKFSDIFQCFKINAGNVNKTDSIQAIYDKEIFLCIPKKTLFHKTKVLHNYFFSIIL